MYFKTEEKHFFSVHLEKKIKGFAKFWVHSCSLSPYTVSFVYQSDKSNHWQIFNFKRIVVISEALREQTDSLPSHQQFLLTEIYC